MNDVQESVTRAAKGLASSFPILIGVMLLVSLMDVLIPLSFYERAFTGNIFSDSFIGSLIGSVLAGNPMTSYVMGGEFLSQGVSMVAVAAFLVAWVTVGIINIPAESMMLGRRFTIVRNINAFILSIVIAILTVLGVGLL
ncbi:MAG: hypothetical protein ACLFTR_03510 [Candidatus Woesearchaeota archaeon]